VADGLEQPLDLVVLAFVELHLDPGVLVGLDDTRAIEGEQVALDAHPRAQPRQHRGVGNSAHLGLVHARHLVAGMRHLLREGAVVREQDQPLGGHVEAPDGKQPRHARHQVHHGHAPLGVVARRDHALRLVQQEIDGRRGGPQPLAVDPDVVDGGVGLAAQLGHDLPVDRHPPLRDGALRRPARRDAGPGQDLLQPLLHEAGLYGARRGD
jgi:hypothetical protein